MYFKRLHYDLTHIKCYSEGRRHGNKVVEQKTNTIGQWPQFHIFLQCEDQVLYEGSERKGPSI